MQVLHDVKAEREKKEKLMGKGGDTTRRRTGFQANVVAAVPAEGNGKQGLDTQDGLNGGEQGHENEEKGKEIGKEEGAKEEDMFIDVSLAKKAEGGSGVRVQQKPILKKKGGTATGSVTTVENGEKGQESEKEAKGMSLDDYKRRMGY